MFEYHWYSKAVPVPLFSVTSTESDCGIPFSQISCDKSVDPVLSNKSPPLSRVGTSLTVIIYEVLSNGEQPNPS